MNANEEFGALEEWMSEEANRRATAIKPFLSVGTQVAWEIKSAHTHESLSVDALLTTLRARGFTPETAALDKA